MEDSYSEIIEERFDNIVESLYSLQSEIIEYINSAEIEEDDDEVKALERYKKYVDKMIDCI